MLGINVAHCRDSCLEVGSGILRWLQEVNDPRLLCFTIRKWSVVSQEIIKRDLYLGKDRSLSPRDTMHL